jgi:dethiobiotin synthetase
MSRFVVAGTDTDVGKTVFAAALAGALGATYFKPVQCGLEPPTDSETALSLGVKQVLPEIYRLTSPLSPHRAAEIDGVAIELERLVLPAVDPLVVEPAGGLMVPVTRKLLFIDIIQRWQLPVILCARTALGTINHSLLSIEALKRRSIRIDGVAFIGEENKDTERTIVEMGSVRRLGRLPWVDPLNAQTLAAAFASGFKVETSR